MLQTYRDQSSNDRINAQLNLWGKTHYVTDSTLRYHHSRITYSQVLDGDHFLICEAYAVDMHNTKRRKRCVIFDKTGTVLYRPELDQGYSTTDIAVKKARTWYEENIKRNAHRYFGEVYVRT